MYDRKRRLLWTIAAIMLPGPWTPVIVLLYALRGIHERTWDIDNGPLVPHPPSESDSTARERAGHAPIRFRRDDATGSMPPPAGQRAPKADR